MLKNFEEFQKFGSDGADVVFKQFGAFSKVAQAIASEVADYSKEAFESTAAAAEKIADSQASRRSAHSVPSTSSASVWIS